MELDCPPMVCPGYTWPVELEYDVRKAVGSEERFVQNLEVDYEQIVQKARVILHKRNFRKNAKTVQALYGDWLSPDGAFWL